MVRETIVQRIPFYYQFSHLLMMVQHDKKTDTGKLNFGQYHCIIANREVIVILGNQDTVVLNTVY